MSDNEIRVNSEEGFEQSNFGQEYNTAGIIDGKHKTKISPVGD